MHIWLCARTLGGEIACGGIVIRLVPLPAVDGLETQDMDSEQQPTQTTIFSPSLSPLPGYIWAQACIVMGSCAAVAQGGGPLIAVRSPSGISIDFINDSQLRENTSSTASFDTTDTRWAPKQALQEE